MELSKAHMAYVMCRVLELTIGKAYECHDITETEYKFVLRALQAVVDSEAKI